MIVAYRILTHNLPRATKEMNVREGPFSSEVVDIIKTTYDFIVIVDVQGSYPNITDRWKEFIEDDRT